MRKRIYVSGPLSKGGLYENIRRACLVGEHLIREGYAPLVPHLTCYMGGQNPSVSACDISHRNWLATDLPWVAAADAVIRLSGESVGAGMEVQLAHQLGIPVFYSVEALMLAMPVTHGDLEFPA